MVPAADVNAVKQAFLAAAPPGGWSAYLDAVFEEERTRLTHARNGPDVDFLKLFPAKSYYTHATRQFDVQPEAALRPIEVALGLSDADAEKNEKQRLLRDALVGALTPHFWPR